MFISESQLGYKQDQYIDLMDVLPVLEDGESFYDPAMVPIVENTNYDRGMIRIEDINEFAEANGIYDMGYAISAICESSGIHPADLLFTIKEETLYMDENLSDIVIEMVESGIPVATVPISDYDPIAVLGNFALNFLGETGSSYYLDAFANEDWFCIAEAALDDSLTQELEDLTDRANNHKDANDPDRLSRDEQKRYDALTLFDTKIKTLNPDYFGEKMGSTEFNKYFSYYKNATGSDTNRKTKAWNQFIAGLSGQTRQGRADLKTKLLAKGADSDKADEDIAAARRLHTKARWELRQQKRNKDFESLQDYSAKYYNPGETGADKYVSKAYNFATLNTAMHKAQQAYDAEDDATAKAALKPALDKAMTDFQNVKKAVEDDYKATKTQYQKELAAYNRNKAVMKSDEKKKAEDDLRAHFIVLQTMVSQAKKNANIILQSVDNLKPDFMSNTAAQATNSADVKAGEEKAAAATPGADEATKNPEGFIAKLKKSVNGGRDAIAKAIAWANNAVRKLRDKLRNSDGQTGNVLKTIIDKILACIDWLTAKMHNVVHHGLTDIQDYKYGDKRD